MSGKYFRRRKGPGNRDQSQLFRMFYNIGLSIWGKNVLCPGIPGSIGLFHSKNGACSDMVGISPKIPQFLNGTGGLSKGEGRGHVKCHLQKTYAAQV